VSLEKKRFPDESQEWKKTAEGGSTLELSKIQKEKCFRGVWRLLRRGGRENVAKLGTTIYPKPSHRRETKRHWFRVLGNMQCRRLNRRDKNKGKTVKGKRTGKGERPVRLGEDRCDGGAKLLIKGDLRRKSKGKR